MPDTQDAAQRAGDLRRQIDRHDRLYHVKDAPEISDTEYDRLFAELQRLEQAHPDLATPDSPTQRVGAEPLSDLGKVEHVMPMLSLDAVRNDDDIAAFLERVRDETGDADSMVVAEPKFDGLSIEVVYENGGFLRGATRGDGETGEDISHTLRPVRALPLHLEAADDLGDRVALRGEAVLPISSFQKVNKARVERGDPGRRRIHEDA